VDEVCGRIMPHTDAAHNPAGGLVCDGGFGHNFIQFKFIEPEVQDLNSRLGGVTIAPKSGRQSPADLDSRRKRRLKWHAIKARKTDESAVNRQLKSPKAETISFKFSLDIFNPLVALRTAEARRHIPHCQGIGIYGGEWNIVTLAPPSKQKSICSKHD
jgi:hypothetical protein